MSISDQIFAAHCGKPTVTPGEFVECAIDLVMVHEQLGGRIAPEFEKLHKSEIWDPTRVFFILDHWVPPPSVSAAAMHQTARNFVKKYGIIHDMGQNLGICHQVLPEFGFSRPGMLIVGSDSHTTTYGALNCLGIGIGATDVVSVFDQGKLWFKIPETVRFNLTGKLPPGVMGKDVALWILEHYRSDGFIYQALEFGGSGLKNLSIDARMSIANMSVETGAKCAVFESDHFTYQWLANHPVTSKILDLPSQIITPQKDANYLKEITIDLNEMQPRIAKPYNPDQVIVAHAMESVRIDQAFLGSCTNGRLEDLRIAARIIKGKKVAKHVRFIVIPASREIYLEALKEGLIEIFVQAGGVVEYPSCGPCIGGHLGVLGPNEICISSSNRNFKGRMGDPTSQTYLASPATVTASAIAGYITSLQPDTLKPKVTNQ